MSVHLPMRSDQKEAFVCAMRSARSFLIVVCLMCIGANAQAQGLALTPYGISRNFILTTFISGFPIAGNLAGPFGVAFLPGGPSRPVLVSDSFGRILRFPNHDDNQVYSPARILATYSPGLRALAQTQDNRYFLARQFNGNDVIEIDPATGVQLAWRAIVPGAIGLAPFPPPGQPGGPDPNHPRHKHLFVSSDTGQIFDVDTTIPGGNPTVFANVPGNIPDGITFNPRGDTLYVARIRTENVIMGWSVPTTGAGTLVYTSPPLGDASLDGIAVGLGTLSGYLYVNTNVGTVWEIGLPWSPTPNSVNRIASGGSRGDFIATDPAVSSGGPSPKDEFPTLLLTQSDRILRLDPPGGGWFGPPMSVTTMVSDAPVFTSVSEAMTAFEGTAVSLSASATDADAGETVGVTASGFPSSLILAAGSAVMPDTTTATVSGILGDHDGDTNPTIYTIAWVATDGVLSASASTQLTVNDVVPMGFDFTPGTLNLRSMGRWVTGYLEPPTPFTLADIDTPSVRINDTVPVDLTAPIEVGDHDNDGIPDLMVKFNRALVDLTVSAGDSVPVTVTGTVAGTSFSGVDYVRVIRAVVTAPASGSVLPAGGVTTVRWTTPSGVEVQSVALLSSTDDGLTWSLDAHGLPNTGSADWIAPGTVSDKARVAVVLVESADETGYTVDGVLGTSGTFSIGNVTGVDAGAQVEFALRVVRPNPTLENLQVSFGLPEARPAKLEVFNVSGRLVASREVGSLGVGFHMVTLGGRGALPSGVYLVRLTQGGRSLTTRAVIVR
jgi:hypothetical protein